jgi:Fe-S cluster assembly iron-binding protein IscA
MALDEPKENDEVFDKNGLKFLINKELLDSAKPINVEFVETPRGSGFSVTSGLTNKDSGCGSCSC